MLAETIIGRCKALASGACLYTSNTAGQHSAEGSAAVASTTDLVGSGSFTVSGSVPGASVSGSVTVNWNHTTGHQRIVDADADLVSETALSNLYAYFCKTEADVNAWADGGDAAGVGASRAKADLGGYIFGNVILSEL
jgi:hypothetical protein